MKKDTGQRDIKSVVGVQLNWALPDRLWLFGNNGEGRTILPASRIRLSQKISSAVAPGSGAARGAFAFLPSRGSSSGNSLAVPRLGLLSLTAATARPI